MSESAERFRTHVERLAKEHGVAFVFTTDQHLPYPTTDDLVNGYTVEVPRRELGVAGGSSERIWLPVLAHEAAHLDQMLEDADAWKEASVPGTNEEAVDSLFLWTEGSVELSPEQLDDYIRRARNVELDCERRAVRKIQEFELPISIPEYIQMANSYIFFYTALKDLHAWYVPGKEPYTLKEVWSLCPTEFLADDAYAHVPEGLMEAYRTIV